MANNKLRMCPDCLSAHQDHNWYIGDIEREEVVTAQTCSVHPSMSNYRVMRTLKTLIDWSDRPAGFKHKMRPNVVLHVVDGLLSRAVSELILFDYEQPFLDLLIAEGCLIEQDNGLIKVTEKGRGLARIKDVTGLTKVEA